MSPLNPEDWNIPFMVVTEPTFQPEMSALKEPRLRNKFAMVVTAETSHVPMAGLHIPVGEVPRHLFTADHSVESV